MKKLHLIGALVLCSFKTVAPATLTVDKMHAKISFSITHNMTSDVEEAFKNQ